MVLDLPPVARILYQGLPPPPRLQPPRRLEDDTGELYAGTVCTHFEDLAVSSIQTANFTDPLIRPIPPQAPSKNTHDTSGELQDLTDVYW